jgi:Zn-dependent oligopeptidase
MKILRAGVAALVAALVLWALTAVAPAKAALDTTPFFTGLDDPDSVTKQLGGHLDVAQQKLDELVAFKGTRTVENTLRLYDEITFEISSANGPSNVIANLHPDAAMRKAGESVLVRAKTMDGDKLLNRVVYDALASIDASRADAQTRYYLARELRRFQLDGVDKDAATRERIGQLRTTLATATGEFRANTRSTGTVAVAGPADLDGLPPDFIARQKPGVTGGLTLRADGSNYAVLVFAKSEDVRKRFFTELANVGYPQNIEPLNRMLALRWDIAHLLGFESWAAYEDAGRMVGSAKAAAAFIDNAIREAKPKASREYQEVLDRKRVDAPGATKINAWEFEYYRELVRREKYDFDSQSVRPYFSYDRVKQGLLDVATRMFGVTFRPAKNVPVWFPSVDAYEVLDNETLIGRVYFDTHPRPNKQNSGGFTSMARAGFAGREIPEGILVANVPGGAVGDPGLLTYDDVRAVMFHEFSHVITNILAGHQRWYGLTRHAEDDYGEVTAKLFEEWALNPAVLALYAKRFDTNAPMPDELVARMRRALEFSKGMKNVGDLSFSRFAFVIHDRDPKKVDPTAVWRDVLTTDAPWLYADGTHREASFTHLANPNYSSGYYAYQWALAIEKDMLSTQFDEQNLLAPGPAHRLRDLVMKVGGTKPAADIIKDFLGRPFNEKAWSAWINRES